MNPGGFRLDVVSLLQPLQQTLEPFSLQEFLAPFLPRTQVTWLARPFDRSWQRNLQASVATPVSAEELLEKPGACLIAATAGDVAEVDGLLDEWDLPGDLGERGLVGATIAVAAAMEWHRPPTRVAIAVCEYRPDATRSALEVLLLVV